MREKIAGFLTKVEHHNGTGWQNQAEMRYDGLGNRLEMVGYAGTESVTTQYALDNGRVLAAASGENSTFYLYGLGAIGELSAAWSYSLPDGTGTPRQIVNANGEVTLVASYTPWGDTLETYGTGSFTNGYFGGLMDTATGLLYVGSGMYYDPQTGRFLNRNVHPEQSNPYTPWGDPAGAMVAPLALLALVFTNKKKRTKLDYWIIALVLGLSVGMSLTGCAPTATPTIQPTTTITITIPLTTVTPGNAGNDPGTLPSAGAPTTTPAMTCTSTLTPTPSLLPPPVNPDEEGMKDYIASFGITLEGNWTGLFVINLWEALFTHIGYINLEKWLGEKNVTMILGGAGELDCDACYKGWTEPKTAEHSDQITYYYKGGGVINPVVNMTHEIGHLVDNIWDDYFTTELYYHTFYSQESTYLAGWNDESYGSLNDETNRVYKALKVSPIAGGSAWQQRGGTLHWEDWADIFSNYVLGNINQADSLGKQMFDFAKRMENHVMEGTS